MKLKYYLRGMGIGIILTAIVMGFALGGRKAAISDAEVIQRAKALGMVEEGENTTLAQATFETERIEKNDTSASGKTLDQQGKEVPMENQQEASETAYSADNVSDNAQEGQGQVKDKAAEDGKTDNKGAVSEENQVASTDNGTNSASGTASSKASTNDGAATAIVTTMDIADAAQNEAANKGTTSGASSENVSSSDNAATASASATATVTEATGAASAAASESVSTASETATLQETQVAAAATIAATTASAPVTGKSVTIPGGSGSDTVAEILYKEGLVDNAVTFNRYLIEKGVDRKLRSGVKIIPENSDYDQIAAILVQG